MPERIDIRVLGTFEIAIGGRRVLESDWGRRRPMELVQLLALAPSHSLLRDEVIEALWPHLDADAGGANLRKAAHQARQVLGRVDGVTLRTGKVSLFPAAEVATDLEAFQARAAAALAEGSPETCLAAADLAAGELLPGSVYEEWSAACRHRMRTTVLALLRTARAWERIIELEPTDEEAYRALMEEALSAGARSAVVRRFGALQAALARELGVAPAPASVALYEAAIEGLTVDEPELVGRDAELAAVEAALQRTGGRHVGLVAVLGPPGIGKSAFCDAVGDGLRSAGRVVRATAAGRPARSFGPIVRIMEDLVLERPDVLSSLPPHVGSVVSMLTEAAPEAPPVDGPLTRHQVLGSLTQLLRATATGGGSAVLLDDAHDADAGTIDVVLQLASSVPDVLVVLNARPGAMPDGLRAGLDRLARGRALLRTELDGLDPDAAAELVRRVAADGLPAEAVDAIVDRADGNPFALEEMAKAAVPGGGDLPPSVAEAIGSRLVDVDDTTMEALRRLALSRDALDPDLVIALSGKGDDEALAILDRALDAGVLVVEGSRYRFRHDLVRQALSGQVPPHRRRLVHREAAIYLGRQRAAPAVVAHHWLEAGLTDEAVPWCVDAATDAMRVGAFGDARHHLRPVLAHDAGHAEARRLDAECLDMLGDPAALAAYDAAIAVADPAVADDLMAARALAQVKQGDPAGGLAAIRGAQPRSTMGRLNQALTYAGAAALGAADPAVGTAQAAEVRRLALEAGDRAGIVIAAWAHAAAAHARGDLHDSVLADLRETRDLPHLAVRVFDGHLCMTQRFLYGSRPYSEVLSFAEGLTDEARRLGARRGEAFGTTLGAEARFLSGDLDGAYRDFDRGLRLHRETAGTTGEAHALQRLAELQYADGRTADARHTIDEALALARISDIGFHLLDRIYGSRIRVCDDASEALAVLEDAEAAIQGPLETCPGCRIHFAVPAAIAAAEAGDLERARRHADAADYLANVVMRLPAWYAAYDEVLATIARAEGDEERARTLLASAAAVYEAAGHPLDAARCRATG